MVDNLADPQLSCFLNGETMDSYIEQSHMQSLGAWATEIEIIAAASLLQTTIYVYGPCRKMNKWQKYTTHIEKTDDNHFETVKRM